MGELTKMRVTMNAEAWRKAAINCQEKAVAMLAGGYSADRLIKSAELLRASDTFNGRANLMDMFDHDDDTAVVEAWDLADEGMPGEVVPA